MEQILHDPILLSFALYTLYVLLPVIPALVIFWLFPKHRSGRERPAGKPLREEHGRLRRVCRHGRPRLVVDFQHAGDDPGEGARDVEGERCPAAH